MNGIDALVSIIVPIYNSEKYLDRCLSSIKEQLYNNIEIILVNDGSTDRSLEICKQYSKADKRTLIINKKNGGLSDARNVGIKESTGKYIFLLDSDDYIDKECIEAMVFNAERYDCDIVVSDGIYEVEGKVNNYINEALKYGEMLLTPEETIKIFLEHKGLIGSPWVAWGKLYRKELFHDIQFPVGRVSEDLAVLPNLILLSKKIMYIKKRTYHYVIRDGSLIHQGSEKMILDNHYYLKELQNLVYDKLPNLTTVMDIEFVWISMMIGIMPQCNQSNILKEIINDVRRGRKVFLCSDKAFKYKILLIMFSLFPGLTKSYFDNR